jgi:hypothetical protein
MADRSLFNEDLTLSKLTVNNSTSSSASGYVATSTTIVPDKITSPQLAVDLLGIFSPTSPNPPVISSSNNNLIVDLYGTAIVQVNGTGGVSAGALKAGNTITITDGFGNPNDVVLSCPQNNVLNVAGSVIATNVELLSSIGSVNLTAPAGNTLEVSGNLQAVGAVATPDLILQNGANSTTLTASSTTNNTLVVPGNMTVGNSITLPQNAFAFVSSPTFSGGVASAHFTPPTPGAWDCGPGTVTPIVLPAFTFNPVTSALNCPYFFTVQTSNNVTVSVASYSLAQVGTQVTMTLQIANLQAAGGAVVSISVLAFNPSG